MGDITADSSLFNAIPWGGYKTVFVQPKSGYSATDYVDFAGVFKTVKGAFALQSGYVYACSWSGTQVSLLEIGDTLMIVMGTI